MDYVFANIDWEFLISAIVGGLIAGACAITVMLIQHKNGMERELLQDEILINGFLHSVLAEIEVLWSSYQESAGKKLEALEKGKPFLYYYPITQDYFSVYTANSFLVGRIRDPRLRKSIVETYTKSRWLLDSYRQNNEMLQKFNHLDLMRQDSTNPGLVHMMWTQEQALIEFSPKLLELHRQTKVSIDHLRLLAKKKVAAK